MSIDELTPCVGRESTHLRRMHNLSGTHIARAITSAGAGAGIKSMACDPRRFQT